MRPKAVRFGFFLAILGGCAVNDAPTGLGEARVQVTVDALMPSDVTAITLTISAADISPDIVTALADDGDGTWSATVANIPAGT
ncbi:MAG: hypothetical protein AAF658_04260, partial [Myxococcota bacterium]